MSVAAHPDTPPEGEVRAAFQQALWEAEERTLAELRVVRETLRLAAEAATACDSDLAAEVTARGDDLTQRYGDVHDRLLVLMARHAPVAGDLRLAVALLHVNDRIDRMGAQCVNLATLCRAVPAGHRPSAAQVDCLTAMARQADEQIRDAAEVFARRDVEGARRLQQGDRAINEANRRCFTLAVDAAGGDPEDAEAALFGVLMARAIERIGDNAVEIARQAEFVAFGRPAVRA